MRGRHTLLFFFVILLLGCEASLAATTDTLRLTLNDALARAQQANLQLRASTEGVEQAVLAVREKYGALLPSLDASGVYNRHLKKPVIFLPEGSPMGNVLELGSDNSFQATFSAKLPLFALPLYQQISVAKTDLRIAQETERGARVALDVDLRLAFANALLAQASQKVVAATLLRAEETLQRLKNLASQGMASDYDRIRAEVQVSNLRPVVLQTNAGAEVALLTLRLMVGLPDSIPVAPVGSLDSMLQGLPTTPLLAGELNNSSVRLLSLQEDKLEGQRKLVRAAHFPLLSAFASYQWQTQANNFEFSKYRWVDISLVGLQLSVPLFAGFTKYHQEQQLKVGIRRMQFQRQYTVQQLHNQQHVLTEQMNAARASMQASQAAQALAEQGVLIARGRYQVGAATLLELNDAEMALTQAALNYLKAEFDYIKLRLDLEKLTR